MQVIWTKNSIFSRSNYASEADLETAILQVKSGLFGRNRIYLDVKKKIGLKGRLRNIPDGYLIELNGHKPRLYVVENELASHDPLRHIAVQILEFSLSFESEPRAVKNILFNALQENISEKVQCEQYALSHGFRNLDHMLEWLVFESPFAALVIIDEMPEKLQAILARKFQFGIEVLELARYENDQKEYYYHFEPFLADLAEDFVSSTSTTTNKQELLDVGEVDTVVIPAREEGFRNTFLGEDRWHAVRLHGTMRPQIKYIAVYQVAPISAITHIAPVKSIEPWEDTEKFVINFSEPARQIDPIPLVKNGKVKPLYNLRYTKLERLQQAKNLDDIWG
jgi:hypothetical protein